MDIEPVESKSDLCGPEVLPARKQLPQSSRVLLSFTFYAAPRDARKGGLIREVTGSRPRALCGSSLRFGDDRAVIAQKGANGLHRHLRRKFVPLDRQRGDAAGRLAHGHARRLHPVR